MALLSFVTDPLDYFRPSLLLDQQFGMGLDDDDFLQPCLPRKVRRMMLTSPYARPWRSQASKKDKGSTLSVDKDKFQVSLDVQQFTPEEITVKASDDTITIEGKHEEKEDEHGFISRHFIRKYKLPEGHDISQVTSKLSTDGVLTITAPKSEEKIKERNIPISFTGQPSQIEATPTIEVGADDKKPEEKKEARKRK
ncbi:Protein lethal(2)essential for life-like Protein [Tribolium castaneum]|uniref:Protein lethal(2)essential for life-like Protein n=1 Tax=Tribolium castaneum TaxID=7070 RepID=D6WHH1_TRICA|nr:PREDICTED: protein lethal(2)essential for life [Tribolium castaneum]EFA00665.1 Protein lethal(2)essential for life-like Protein [Tribolium castaneum]|eukprot:XP_975377.1 PREDICTED: protein lethal(2)essential for life [Tribolium castaneum]